MAIELIAKIRRFVVGKAGLSPIIARATGLESLAMAQVESSLTQETQAGDRFQISVVTAIPTGGLTVAAQATTAAQFILWNADTQKSYVFDTLGMLGLTAGVLTSPFGFIVQCALFSSPAATGAQYADLAATNCSNGGPASKAIIQRVVTITTPAAPTWYTIAKNATPATGVAAQLQMSAINRDIRGRIIVPPGNGIAFNAYAITTGTPKFIPVACWTEVELDLE